MRIAMLGAGYVGLVSGACFSDFGHEVICVDKDAGKIARLLKGEMPIFEPGLERLVADNVAAHRLSFTTDLADMADRQLVIEAIIEDVVVKSKVFADLDDVITDPDAVLASNTSSMPITVPSRPSSGAIGTITLITGRPASRPRRSC